jgi:hypothetical protein
MRRPTTIAGMLIHLARRRISRRAALGTAAVAAGAGAAAAAAALASRGDDPVERIYCDGLRDLRDIDCPVPRCTREAYGTGFARLETRWGGRNWWVEYHCPRCGETFSTWSEATDAMVERLSSEGRCAPCDARRRSGRGAR